MQCNCIAFNLKVNDNVCEPTYLHSNVWALLVQPPQQSPFLMWLYYYSVNFDMHQSSTDTKETGTSMAPNLFYFFF